MKKFNFKKRLLSALIAISTLFNVTITAYADEESTIEDTLNYTVVNSKDTSYDRALKILELTPKEAAECTIYCVESEPTKTRGITIPNNSGFYYFDTFSFSESNNGSYWTCKGNYIKWGVDWYGTYDSNYDLRLNVLLYKYPMNSGYDLVDQIWKHNRESYTSSWLPAIKNLDYRFLYRCDYLTIHGTGYATVSMYVATKD